jgi:hypothetical protein
MPNTYTLISSVTVGAGGASSIDFTSIPSTYTDLILKVSARNSSTGANNLLFTFNSSTSSFTMRQLYGTGSSAASTTTPARFAGQYTGTDMTASTFASTEIYIPNYAGSNNKSYSIDDTTENNATTSYATLTAGLWSNTSALTSITFALTGGSLAQYSTAYLYGIKNS